MIAGRYTLEREIGRGGAGSVHLGHDTLLDRTVAIKRIGLLPGTTGQDIARAEREARLAAGINHPHVVSIFDLVKDEDCYWLVMEHVDGRTLTQVVTEEGPLPPTRAAGIVAQAADALVQADRAGIVHRDVKPGNIMVGDDDHAKLADFGIARSGTDAALTQTGFITGSPAYLAPEVASGSPAAPASDVWSLGGTLLYALTGRPPYDVSGNVMGGLYRIVHEDPPRLPSDHPLAGLLAVTMAKDPAERWPVEQVRDDLRLAARGLPSRAPAVAARPDRTAEATAPMAAPVPMTPGPDEDDSPTRTTSFPATPVAPPPGPPADGGDAPSRSFPLGRAVAVLALVVLAGLGAWQLRPDDGAQTESSSGPASEAPSPTKDSRGSEQPSEGSTPSGEASTEPSPEVTGTTPADMRAFVEDYFATVTSDPEETWTMLTPEFQEESGGYDRYAGFWGTIESATPSAIEVDRAALTASYTIDYVTTSGRTRTEQGELQLAQQGDQLLIAGEG
ncbi:serine/threonine-protein kinase [Nocardioides sp.]|uniref:serine/threonine-protein kinase n=1 Tax=Nocardioides sp. TaxID=35761 RepID=UPI0035B2F2A4